jgi:hypothetical protein
MNSKVFLMMVRIISILMYFVSVTFIIKIIRVVLNNLSYYIAAYLLVIIMTFILVGIITIR